MRPFLKSSFAAAVLAVGIVSGCDVNLNSRSRQSDPVVYAESAPQSYWAYEGRVYGRDSPGNFYVYEGNRRGPQVRDSRLVIQIQGEGRQHNNYIEADRNRHDKNPKPGPRPRF